MSSSSTSGVSYDGKKCHGCDGGFRIPRSCRCGEASIIRTLETEKNLGRLFYCCLFGSKENKNHLFKWVDVSMVEEMGMVGRGFEKMREEVENLAMETRTCEAVANNNAEGCKEEIQQLKAMVNCCEKELGELKSAASCRKNMIVCGLGLVLFIYFIST